MVESCDSKRNNIRVHYLVDGTAVGGRLDVDGHPLNVF